MPHTPQRKTKIVATLGPACDTQEKLVAMIKAGMDVARLNLSHGTHDEHRQRIQQLREAAEQAGTQIAIMIDTRGIEIRTGTLKDGPVELEPGNIFTLYTNEHSGDGDGVSVTYRNLAREVTPGTPILLDDGAIEFEVREVEGSEIRCVVISSSMADGWGTPRASISRKRDWH